MIHVNQESESVVVDLILDPHAPLLGWVVVTLLDSDRHPAVRLVDQGASEHQYARSLVVCETPTLKRLIKQRARLFATSQPAALDVHERYKETRRNNIESGHVLFRENVGLPHVLGDLMRDAGCRSKHMQKTHFFSLFLSFAMLLPFFLYDGVGKTASCVLQPGQYCPVSG